MQHKEGVTTGIITKPETNNENEDDEFIDEEAIIAGASTMFTTRKASASCLDTIAENYGGKTLLPLIFSTLLADIVVPQEEWKKREAVIYSRCHCQWLQA